MENCKCSVGQSIPQHLSDSREAAAASHQGFPSRNPGCNPCIGVNAIPHTFTIDTDGVLQDEHIGDASLEGKLKKLLAQARELQVAHQPAQ